MFPVQTFENKKKKGEKRGTLVIKTEKSFLKPNDSLNFTNVKCLRLCYRPLLQPFGDSGTF